MCKINHKFLILSFIIAFALIINSKLTFSQDTSKVAAKATDKPVENTFNSSVFLDNQTCLTNNKKQVELIINHRFGKISDGSKMAWGLYSPSNIRVSVNYSILNNLQIFCHSGNFLLEYFVAPNSRCC